MNSIKRISEFLILTIFFVVFGFIFLQSNETVYAATSNRFPSAGVGDTLGTNDSIFFDASTANHVSADATNGYLVVSKADGVTNTLQAGNNTIVVYFTTAGTKTITIESAKQCGGADSQGSRPDGTATTSYQVLSLGNVAVPKTNMVGAVASSTGPISNGGSCSPDANISFDVNVTNYPHSFVGVSGTYYAVKIRASSTVAFAFVNGYKIRAFTDTGNVQVSLPKDNGGSNEDTYFALQRRPGSGSGQRNYAIYFASDCSITAPTPLPFYWYDDDWKFIEQDQKANLNMGLQVAERPKGSTGGWTSVPISRTVSASNAGSPLKPTIPGDGQSIGVVESKYIDATTGTLNDWHRIITKNDGSGDAAMVNVTFKRDYEYRVMITKVSGENGIRFTLPFESIYKFLPPCGPVLANPSGSITYDCTLPGVRVTLNSQNSANKGYIDVTASSGAAPPRRYLSSNYLTSTPLLLSSWSGFTFQPGVIYTFRLYGYGSDGQVRSATGVINGTLGTATNSACAGGTDISYYPFFQALGADVVVGGGFGACTPKSSNIFAYMRSNHLGGSGSQLGSFAGGNIAGFRSAISNTNQALGNALSFGHKNIGLTQDGDTGGDFVPAIGCMKDYFNDTKDSGLISNSSLSSIGDIDAVVTTGRQTSIVNNLVTFTGDGSYAKKHTIYVDGNVYISGNIAYSGSPWGSISTIPNFTLVVRGNIYIDKAVTQLDGVYIAQPRNTTTGGTIYTCANSTGGYALSSIATNCLGGGYGAGTASVSQLTFNGAVVANKLVLNRAIGDIVPTAPAASMASEVFNFTPEVLLSPPVFKAEQSSGNGVYDDIGILPPIL